MDQEFIVAAYETKDMGHISIKLTTNTRGLPKLFGTQLKNPLDR